MALRIMCRAMLIDSVFKEDPTVKKSLMKKATPYLFLLPFLVLFCTFMIYPIFYALAISFMKYRAGVYTPVGLTNYIYLIGDATFRKAIGNTFLIMVIQVPIMVGLSLLMACLLNAKAVRCKGFFRLCIFMPILIDTVSYSIEFSLLFNNNESGLINSFLALFGKGPLAWMNDATLAKIVIVCAVTWRWVGYNMILLLSGLQNISPDLYEAAEIDGASPIRQFLHITIPELWPVLIFVIILAVNGVLQLFTEPYLITNGGPINGTMTIVQYLYNMGFKKFNYGVASAGAYVLAVAIGILTFFQLKVSRRDD